MMTILQILRNVELGRNERSEYVRIVGLRHGRSKKTGLPKTILRAYSKKKGYTSAHHYAITVDAVDAKSHVKVSCSCPDFLFAGYEFMLMTRQAADLIYGNGEAPVDPPKPGCCKHLVMAFREMLNQKILRPDMTYRELKK